MRISFLGVMVFLTAAAFADPSVTVTSVSASAKGAGFVDIAYTTAGVEAGTECSYELALTVGGVAAASFTDFAWCDLPVANGGHTVTWNAKADGVETPDLSTFNGAIAPVTATKADADYMIVDTSAGKTATSYPVRYAKAGANVTTAQFNKPEYKLHKIAFKRVKVGDFLETTVGDQTYPYTFKMGEGTVASGTKWHPVRLTKDYFLGIFEVTQRQYENVTGANPSAYKTKESNLESIKAEITDYTMHPANQLVYDTISGADGLFERLSARLGVAVGAPTEAQWEFACRAGCENKYHWGADIETAEGELVEDRYGWNNLNSSPNAGTGRTTHGVGELLPNAWGFYDMTGNCFEYCSDFHAAYKSNSKSVPEEDPTGAASGSKVIRGGAFSYNRTAMASGFRYPQSSSSPGAGWGGYWSPMMGVRLAMTVEAE